MTEGLILLVFLESGLGGDANVSNIGILKTLERGWCKYFANLALGVNLLDSGVF